MTIHGVFHDGKSSHQSAATIELTGNDSVRLSFEPATADQTDSHIVMAGELFFSSRLGNSARYITCKDLGRFETRDNDGVDALVRSLNMKGGWLHTLESNLGLIVIAIIITVLTSWATIRYGVPTAADALVEMLPEKTSDYLEQKLINKWEQELFEPSRLSPDRQTQLEQLFDQVAVDLGVDRSDYNFKLRNAENSIGANALALPDGSIIMTDQLIDMADSNLQLAGIMAHEIGHIDGKHSLRQIVRASIFTFIIAFITGDVTGVSSVVLGAPAAMIELRYSREFEHQADDYAMRYFNCDTDGLQAMGAFFAKLNTQSSEQDTDSDANNSPITEVEPSRWPDILSTHPGSKERQQRFEQHILTSCSH